MDISSSSVKLVELTDAGKGNPRVERYAIEALPKDAVLDGNIANLDAVVDSVQRGWKRMGTRTKNVALALPTAEVLSAASRKEKVEDRVAVAEASGLKAIVMDVESYAIQASFELIQEQFPDHGKDQNIALVDLGANVMNITVLRNEQTVYAREQAFGGSQLTQDIMRVYGMSLEEAEAAKRSGGLPENFELDVLRPFMENAALEMQRAMQFFFTSTQYTSVEHVLLTGGSAVIPGLDEMVQSRTQINTLVAKPSASMAACWEGWWHSSGF